MKDEQINNFFKEHKQILDENSFEERLMQAIKVLPVPVRKQTISRTWLITAVSSLIGVALFVLLGGSESLSEGLEQIFYTISVAGKITPEIIVSAFFVLLMLAGVSKFAIEEF